VDEDQELPSLVIVRPQVVAERETMNTHDVSTVRRASSSDSLAC